MDELAKACVFLGWPADDGEGPNGPGAVINFLDLNEREGMGEAVVAEVVAKRTLGFC